MLRWATTTGRVPGGEGLLEPNFLTSAAWALARPLARRGERSVAEAAPPPAPTADRAVAPKPLLRGWSHALAAAGAVALTAALCWASRSDPPRLGSLLIFGLSMIELYTVSASYHIGAMRRSRKRVRRALDDANSFVLIAGTATPLCFNLLTGWVRIT